MNFAIMNMEGFIYFLRWVHYFSGIIWIGHLYYFNFTQTPFMAEADAAVKSGVQQKLLPRALWWFRWGAMFTFLSGLTILSIRAAQNPAVMGQAWGIAISTGAAMAITMWANVWFVIWPKQKIVIQNAVDVAAGKPANPAVPAIAAGAALASRTNTMLSLPMLFFMGAGRHLPFETQHSGLYYAVFFVILGLIEMNALKGKMGPMATVRGVVHLGVALTVVMYVLMEVLTKI